jgi:hypothetical protein
MQVATATDTRNKGFNKIIDLSLATTAVAVLIYFSLIKGVCAMRA